MVGKDANFSMLTIFPVAKTGFKKCYFLKIFDNDSITYNYREGETIFAP